MVLIVILCQLFAPGAEFLLAGISTLPLASLITPLTSLLNCLFLKIQLQYLSLCKDPRNHPRERESSCPSVVLQLAQGPVEGRELCFLLTPGAKHNAWQIRAHSVNADQIKELPVHLE